MQELVKVHCIHYFSNHTVVNVFWLTFKYLKECKTIYLNKMASNDKIMGLCLTSLTKDPQINKCKFKDEGS